MTKSNSKVRSRLLGKHVLGHATVQAVSCRFLTTESLVQSHIGFRRSDKGEVLLREFRFSPVSNHSSNIPQLIIFHPGY